MSIDNNLDVHGYAVNYDLHTEASNIFGEAREPVLAKRVYQMVFAGYDGSTFPVAFWPVKTWNSCDVLSSALDAMQQLQRRDFQVYFDILNINR